MGSITIGSAIVKLHAVGIRAQRGYPGMLMPHLTGAVAAVNIHKEEPEKTTLVAEVCAPMNMGVYACEDLAEKVALVDGAISTQLGSRETGILHVSSENGIKIEFECLGISCFDVAWELYSLGSVEVAIVM